MLRSTIVREWQAWRAFQRLDASFRRIVFYSEGAGDWPHIGPVIEQLLSDESQRLSYITSDRADPGLALDNDRFRRFLIGSGSIRTMLFRSIKCRHFVMTLPDLNTFHLKRSEHGVHYVYLFHALNSTHTVYRQGAFDAFDTVLCGGPHHIDEIRKTEAVYDLRRKELIEHGSVKLDTILTKLGTVAPVRRTGAERLEALVAPSWGECSLIESSIGVELIETLVRRGIRTVLRLHPMTVRRLPALVTRLTERFRGQEELFAVEEDMNATASWLRSDVMISDWSGAAIEYAFALQKPVIYLNTPPKINNPEWQRIGLRGFEDFIRYEIGDVVEPSALASLPDIVERSYRDAPTRRDDRLALRRKWVFNVGRSAQVAADYLATLP